jgi:hypothetical protein
MNGVTVNPMKYVVDPTGLEVASETEQGGSS